MNPSRAVRTSLTDPIAVDWLPLTTTGKVGMTIAPGKHSGSMSGAPWRRDLALDLDRLRGALDVRVLACLLEDHELTSMRIEPLVAEAEARGIDVLRLPIVDGGIPDRIEPLLELVATIGARAGLGHNVVVHCAAGLGRSGVVAGSVLVAHGASAADAIATLHRVRGPRSPENRRQEAYLEEVERALRSR